MKNFHASRQGLKIHHVYGVKDGAAVGPLPGSAEECHRHPSLSFPPEYTAMSTLQRGAGG